MLKEMDIKGVTRFLEEPGDVFAVIDPVNWPESLDLLSRHDPESLLLFRDRPEEDLFPLLPRIVRLQSRCPFTEIFLGGLGKGWGVIFKTFAEESLVDVLAHMLRITNVLLPDKKMAWFRFYDPYILETMLTHFDPLQLAFLHGGKISSFLVENPVKQCWALYEKPEHLPDATESQLALAPSFLERLDQAHYTLFLSELTLYCREKYFPDAPATDAVKIAEAVRSVVQIAEENGLVTMDQLSRFVHLAVLHGPGFYLDENAAKILHSSCDGPEDKLETLESHMASIPGHDVKLFYV